MKNNIIAMNYVILIILFVLIFFSFIYGMSVVHFEIFPFDFIKKLKISVLSDMKFLTQDLNLQIIFGTIIFLKILFHKLILIFMIQIMMISKI